MDLQHRTHVFAARHRDLALDVIRIYLGLGLFAKGVYFAGHTGSVMPHYQDSLVVSAVVLSHWIALAHLTGGLLLAAGLLTRVAAGVQVPILFGAVFGVHLREGLFGPSQNLEFTVLVLFLLVLFVIYGGGRWSADFFLTRREALLSGRPPEDLSGTA